MLTLGAFVLEAFVVAAVKFVAVAVVTGLGARLKASGCASGHIDRISNGPSV